MQNLQSTIDRMLQQLFNLSVSHAYFNDQKDCSLHVTTMSIRAVQSNNDHVLVDLNVAINLGCPKLYLGYLTNQLLTTTSDLASSMLIEQGNEEITKVEGFNDYVSSLDLVVKYKLEPRVSTHKKIQEVDFKVEEKVQ